MKASRYWLFAVGLITSTAFAQKSMYTNWGITLGVSSTKLAFKDKGGAQSTASGLSFDRSTDLTGGIFAEMKFMKASWFSIRHDLTHRKYDAESSDYYQGVGQTHAFGSVTASYIKYSLSFRAALTKTAVQPFITAGVSTSLLLSQSNNFLIDYGVTQQRQPLLTGVKSLELGFYGGAGVSYNRFAGEVRIEASNGLRPSDMKSPVSSVYIMLAYRLLEGNQ
jgi:hypothetical protein